jgi:hypothetical protein
MSEQKTDAHAEYTRGYRIGYHDREQDCGVTCTDHIHAALARAEAAEAQVAAGLTLVERWAETVAEVLEYAPAAIATHPDVMAVDRCTRELRAVLTTTDHPGPEES